MQKLIAASVCAVVFGAKFKRSRTSRAECGVKGASTGMQIVNGEQADECEWIWQVGLKRSQSGMPFCGGMLIKPDWVLTAAHCMGSSSFTIAAGDYKPLVTGKQQYRTSARVIKHPGYNRNTMDNDYALVQLDAPMDLGSSCVGTVCLPEEDVAPGTECWITGWGTLTSGGSSPDVLMEAPVKILDSNKCGAISDEILPSMICAQGRAKNGSITDACQGDSGGPLVCKTKGSWVVYGATSWGYGCAGKDNPGVWARVHHVMEWIEGTMDGTIVPLRCPSWSAYSEPDRDGDCKCRGSKKCSTTGGDVWNCPTSDGLGAYGGKYFLPTCENCACYKP